MFSGIRDANKEAPVIARPAGPANLAAPLPTVANLLSNLLGTFLDCGLMRSPAGPTVDDEALTFGLTVGLAGGLSVAVLLPAPNLGPPVRLTSTLVFLGGLPREVLTFLRLILSLVEGLDSALSFLASVFLASGFLASGFSLAGFAGLSLESLRLCRSFCLGLVVYQALKYQPYYLSLKT